LNYTRRYRRISDFHIISSPVLFVNDVISLSHVLLCCLLQPVHVLPDQPDHIFRQLKSLRVYLLLQFRVARKSP